MNSVALAIGRAIVVLTVAASAAQAADWPQFRGPNRDGRSAETGLLQTWPKDGPKRLWTNNEIGYGWSSASIAKGRIYTTGIVGQDITMTCTDLSGKKLWQSRLEKAGSGNGFRGTRSTPTVDGDRLFVLTFEGGLYCVSAADGKKLWDVNILKRYSAPNLRHAMAESPLVWGERVIVCPGGKSAMAAFDRTTGEELWKAPRLDEQASYSSTIAINLDGLEMAVNVSAKHVFGIDATGGRFLWKQPHETPWDVNATTPLWHEGTLYVTSGYNVGGEALKLSRKGDEVAVESVWKEKAPDDQMGGVVIADGRLFGTGMERKGLSAIDFKTGKQAYRIKEIGQSSIIWADGRLYCQGWDGWVRLVETKDGRIAGEFRLAAKDKQMWAHPAISDGRLYVRHDGGLSAFDISGDSKKGK